MFRQLCSFYMLQRQVNDAVRSKASADAAAARRGDGAEFIHGEPTSHKLAGPKYVVLAPDPCEDPDKVYVDLVVKICPGSSRSMSDVWENVTEKLRELGPWSSDGEPSSTTSAATTTVAAASAAAVGNRREAMKTLVFVGRLDPAPVDEQQWLEQKNMFARRLSLKHLCDIIESSGAITNKKQFFTELFQTPEEVVHAADIMGIANRSRFTLESFTNWFFSFDTFSKCMVFYEAVNNYLQANASPLSLILDDIYCDVFTQIIRQSYITRVSVKQTLPDMALSPTEDTKLINIKECVSNFIMNDIQTNDLSFTRRDYRLVTSIYGTVGTFENNSVGAVPGSAITSRDKAPVTESSIDIIRKTLKRKSSDTYRVPFAKRRKQTTVTRYIMIEGSVNGTVSPITVYVRNEPLVPTVHNHLLFPVFSLEREGSNILFFLKLRPFVAAALLLPGVFNHKNNYLHGDCKWMQQQQQPASPLLPPSKSLPTRSSTVWRYTLADYSPLKSSFRETLHPTKTYGNGTTTTGRRQRSVQPLYF